MYSRGIAPNSHREKLWQLAGLFSSLLTDPNFKVRRYVAESVVILFDLFEAPFADIRSRLAPAIEHTKGTAPG